MDTLHAMPDSICIRARHGGFVTSAALFDSGSFGLFTAEAAAMDPQQRFVLEVS